MKATTFLYASVWLITGGTSIFIGNAPPQYAFPLILVAIGIGVLVTAVIRQVEIDNNP